jgi:hypothetical protein
MEKECTECHKILDILSFPSFKRKSGKIYVLNKCADCNREYYKNHYIKNKEKYAENNKRWVAENKESFDEYHAQYRMDHKEKNKNYQKKYQQQNKIKLSAYSLNYVKNKLKENSNFKLRRNISKLISSYLKRYGFRKNGNSILDNLGYTIDELKQHLEKQFEPWMTWDNWGIYDLKTWDDNDSSTWTWQIDHIIPQTKLAYTSMTDDNFQKCWTLENLRPLSSKQNLIKGNR